MLKISERGKHREGRSTDIMPSSYHVLAITALALFLPIIPGTLAVPEIPLDGDIEICRPVYGENLGYFDCRDALARMPSNNNFATYTNSCDAGARNRYLLPLTYESRKFLNKDNTSVRSRHQLGSSFKTYSRLCLFDNYTHAVGRR